jgi:hypothetical protein
MCSMSDAPFVGLRAGFAHRRSAGTTLGVSAAILRQIRDQRIHGPEICRIDELPAQSPLGHEFGTKQRLQMERQRRRRNAQSFGHQASGQAIWTCLDQQPKCGQSMLVRKGSERCEDSAGCHDFFRYFD